MKYLSIVLLSCSTLIFGSTVSNHSVSLSPKDVTATTLDTGTSWNPPSLSTPVVAPQSLISDNVTTTTVAPPPLVSPEVMAKWQKVAQCEQGGNWHVRGSLYSGGLGITEENWMKYGGWKFGAEYAASPEQQIVIAVRIQTAAGIPDYVPDQFGCGRGW